MTAETHSFQAEVGKILDIVARSLYAEREVFLRELVSNASDACDKLRYAALGEPALIEGEAEFAITLGIDEDARTLTVSDNGIGMTREEMGENLGTIARSGTQAFAETLDAAQKSGDQALSLIGQFGVGFYAAFMVADTVTVISRRAGSDSATSWVSDGKGSYTLDDASREMRGTDVILHLKEDAGEFLKAARLKAIIRKHSDHIALPIRLKGEEETINKASALWRRPRGEVSEQEHTEFYHHVSHAFDTPWATLHWRAEGVIEYTGLLYVPTMRPFDLFDPKRPHHVRLYVRRVFINEGAEGLVPSWLRFLRGVIDSEDLPLNVSRETLQHSPVIAKIRQALVRRVLDELARKAEDAVGYRPFWDAFGPVLKEGLYEDHDHREALFTCVRFRSTHGGDGTGHGLVGLEDYVGRMKEGQNAIFYITGEDAEAIARSPQLEGYRAKGVEVLLLTDAIDEFWVGAVDDYQGKPFKSVTRGGGDLSAIKGDKAEGEDAKPEQPEIESPALDSLIALLKSTLGDKIKDVRKSDRLTDSPVCLVADEGDVDIHLERLLKQHNQLNQSFPRILEINAGHKLITGTAARASAGTSPALEDAAWLLLDQARIAEGEPPIDAADFARRLSRAVQAGIAAG